MEGRQSLSTRSFQLAVIPFTIGFAINYSHFNNLLGEITRLHVGDGVYGSQLPLEDEG